MNIIITQEKLKWNFYYKIINKNADTYYAETIRQIIPKLRKIYLKDKNGQIVGFLKETNFFLKILNLIPILNYFLDLPSYVISFNHKYSGRIKTIVNSKQGHIKADFLDRTYEIFHHSGGKKGEKYSVFSQGKQIGLIHRSVYREFGADKYIGDFDYDTNVIFNIFIMLYIEIVWNTVDIVTNFNSNSYTYKWGADILIGRKLDEQWSSKKNI